MIVEAATSSPAGITTAIFTGLGVVLTATAVLIGAIKGQRIVRDVKETKETVGRVEKQTDGALTASIMAEKAAVEAQIVAMRKPSADTAAAIRAAEERLKVLRAHIAAREAAVNGTSYEEQP